MPNLYEEEEEEEEGVKPKKKGRRITDLKVSEISVVDKAANGERFLLYKAAGKPFPGAAPPFKSDEEKEKEDDMTCPECGEDMDDCTCDEEVNKSALTAFTEKYGMAKAEDNLETEEFDEAGVLGILQKHAH